MKDLRCNDNCRFMTGNVNADFCVHHKLLQKGYDKYFCHKNKKLQTKVMGLDQWFQDLIKNNEIVIHAVEYITLFGTVVIWSDNKGYSYSYKSHNGQGTSGTYESIIDLIFLMGHL